MLKESERKYGDYKKNEGGEVRRWSMLMYQALLMEPVWLTLESCSQHIWPSGCHSFHRKRLRFSFQMQRNPIGESFVRIGDYKRSLL